MGNLDVFAACFAYSSATHSFVQRPGAAPRGAPYLSARPSFHPPFWPPPRRHVPLLLFLLDIYTQVVPSLIATFEHLSSCQLVQSRCACFGHWVIVLLPGSGADSGDTCSRRHRARAGSAAGLDQCSIPLLEPQDLLAVTGILPKPI